MPPHRPAPPRTALCVRMRPARAAPRAAGDRGWGIRAEGAWPIYCPAPSRPGQVGGCGRVGCSACALRPHRSLPPPPVPGATPAGGTGPGGAFSRCFWVLWDFPRPGPASAACQPPGWPRARARRLGEHSRAPAAGSGSPRKATRVSSAARCAASHSPQPDGNPGVPHRLPVSQGELARLVCTSAGRF